MPVRSETPDAALLFVYGTLRPKARNEYAVYLRQRSTFVGTGQLPGRLYRIDWFPGAVYDSAAPTVVIGDVLQLHHGRTACLLRRVRRRSGRRNRHFRASVGARPNGNRPPAGLDVSVQPTHRPPARHPHRRLYAVLMIQQKGNPDWSCLFATMNWRAVSLTPRRLRSATPGTYFRPRPFGRWTKQRRATHRFGHPGGPYGCP